MVSAAKNSTVNTTYRSYTYLRTYLLTPCSTALLEKLTGVQPVKKFPPFYGPKVSLAHSQDPSTFPILSDTDPVHAFTSHFLKIRHNIIVRSTPGFCKWPLFLRFPHRDPVYTSIFPHTCYTIRPPHSCRCDHPKKY